MLAGERFGRRRQDFVVIAIQLVRASKNEVRRPVKRRPGDQEGQRLEQVVRPLSVIQRLLLGCYVVKIGQPLQILSKMAGRQRMLKTAPARGLRLIRTPERFENLDP